MARLFAKGFGLASVYAEEEAHRTACASCGNAFAELFDERNDRYLCDKVCVEDYVAENPKEFAKGYEAELIRIDGD